LSFLFVFRRRSNSMSIAFWTTLFIVAIASVLALPVCGAQVVTAVGSAPMTSVAGCTGRPYSGKETTTRIQTRADGTTVEHEDVRLLWRDADGRTRSELVAKTASGAEYRSVMIYEPIKRVYWSWVVGSGSAGKVAHVRPFAATEAPASCWKPVEQVETVRHVPGSDTTVEKLPPTTISGLRVLGNRDTKAIPAGAHGNDRDFTLMHEFWISPDLGVIVRRVIEDPRVGKITTELSNIQRSDPAPALFKVPEGYEVRDDPPPPPSLLDEIMRDAKPALPEPPPPAKNG
jgi:hypothetical protein